MKKLLTLFLILPTLLVAQDSVYVSHSTETVEQLQHVRLIDEFDKAFGQNADKRWRFKAGLYDYSPRLPIAYKGMEFSVEYRLIDNLSARMLFSQKPTTKFDGYQQWRYGVELRNYFKRKEAAKNLNGNYLGLSFLYKKEDGDGGTRVNFGIHPDPPQNSNGGYLAPFNISPYANGHSQVKISLGKQLGSLLDYSLNFGMKQVRPKVMGIDGLYFRSSSASTFIPFLATKAAVGIGLDFPRNKKEFDFCEFINCQKEVKSMLKIDVSNLLYIDSYFRNVSSNLSYEKKLGHLPLSLAGDVGFNWVGLKFFPYSGENILLGSEESGFFERPKFEDAELKWNDNFYYSAVLSLRYYVTQKRDVATGKSAEGLFGLYLGSFVRFAEVGSPKDSYTLYSEEYPFNYGGTVGYQRKILDKYFFDISIDAGKISLAPYEIFGDLNLRVQPNVKFGYAF
ncbi:hypothetical protein [Arcticibacterium luteifluviistationis]|nr:hypothetical protein [Arcticibacterium luteifluviistationis]